MVVDWVTIILLICIGLILIIVELIFVPGTTIVGVLGLALTAVGIWISYTALGTPMGHVVLAVSALIGALAVFYSFRSDAWTRFALNDSNRGRVNEDRKHELEVGELGKSLSALRPQGTALFKERPHEVQTNGEFVSPNTAIRIIKLTSNKIIVEEVS